MLGLRKLLAFSFGPIGSAVLGLLSTPTVAWLFSAEDIGRLSMLQIACTFSVVFFSLGLDQAYVREFHDTKDKGVLLKTTFLPGFLLLLLALGLVVLYDPYLLGDLLFSIRDVGVSTIVFLCLLGVYTTRFLALILRMQERGWAYSISQVLPKVLFLLTIIFMVLWYSGKLHFTQLLIAQAISIISVTAVFGYNTQRVWRDAFVVPLRRTALPGLLSFGLPLIAGGVAYWFLSAMGRIFIRRYASFDELGIYSIAIGIAAGATILSQVFNTVWAPSAYKWIAEGKDFKKLEDISHHLLAAIICLTILSGLFSWLLDYILPLTYSRVSFIIPCCLLAPLLYTLSESTSIGISLSRRTLFSMLASCLAAIIGLIANVLLVPKYGAAGAAISLAIAFWGFLFFRTEFSCYVWRKVPRLKIYITTFIILLSVIGFALDGHSHPPAWFIIWGTLFSAFILIFRTSIIIAIADMRRQIRKYRMRSQQ